MKILVIGSGGREHALCWALAASPLCDFLACAPGNGGIAEVATCVDIGVMDFDGLIAYCGSEAIEFVVVGPEAPLAAGLVDRFDAAGIKSFGPTAAAAVLEGSKGFTKDLCARHGTSGVMVFTTMTVEEPSAVHTRMFAPPIGVTEDPATGSASGALGAYLVQNGVVEVGPMTEILAEQGYEVERPSRILIQVESDDDVIQEVKVGGRAVLVVEGSLTF